MITTRPKNSLAEEVALKGLTSGVAAPAMSPIEQESISILVLNGIADHLKKLEVLSQEGESSEEEVLHSLRGMLAQMSGSLSKNDIDGAKLRSAKAEGRSTIDKLTLEGLQKAAEELLVKIEENTNSMSKKKRWGIFGIVAGIVCLVVPFLAPAAILGIAFGSKAVHEENQISSLSKDIKKALEGLSDEEKAVVYQQLIALLSGFGPSLGVEAPEMSTMSTSSSQMNAFSVPAEEEKEEDDSLYLDLRNALNNMVGSLELNKIDVAKFHAAKAEMSLAMDKLYTDLMLSKHDELLGQVEENAETRAKQAKTSKVAQFFSYLIMAISIAVTAVFSPATAVMMAVMIILSTVPVNSNGDTTLGLLSQSLASGFEKMGMSEEAAAFVANIAVVLLTVVATKGACKGANSAMSGMRTAQRAAAPFGPLTPADAMKYSVKTGAMTELAVVSSIGNLGVISSFIMMLPIEDEDKQKMAADIAQVVGTLVASLWTGKTALGVSGFGRVAGSSDAVYKMQNLANIVGITAGAGSGASSVAVGSYSIQMGNFAYIMRELEAEIMVLNQAISSNAKGQKDSERKQKDMVDAQTMITESYSKLSSGGRALAEAMA